MNILLVDEHTILLDGIAKLLEKSVNEIVATAKTVDEALSYFTEKEFDILITDFNLIDDNGLALIRKAKKIYPNLKIIVLSMHEEALLVNDIVQLGINGFVSKNNSLHDLKEALEAIKTGKVYISEDLNQTLINSIKNAVIADEFSSKELEVLRLIAEDLNNNQIAEQLAISTKSVNSYRKSIYKKTKTSTDAGLLKFAYAHNLI